MSIGNYYGQQQSYGNYGQQQGYPSQYPYGQQQSYGSYMPSPNYNDGMNMYGQPVNNYAMLTAGKTAATYNTGYGIDFSNIPNAQMYITNEMQSPDELRVHNGISSLPLLMGTELNSYLVPMQSYGNQGYGMQPMQGYNMPQWFGCPQYGTPSYGIQAYSMQASGVQIYGMPPQQPQCQTGGFDITGILSSFTNSMSSMISACVGNNGNHYGQNRY